MLEKLQGKRQESMREGSKELGKKSKQERLQGTRQGCMQEKLQGTSKIVLKKAAVN